MCSTERQEIITYHQSLAPRSLSVPAARLSMTGHTDGSVLNDDSERTGGPGLQHLAQPIAVAGMRRRPARMNSDQIGPECWK